jgi:uncharacterized membrane protein
MLCLQFVALALIFFDVPIAKQVVVFLYLTFVPGLVLLKLLKLNEFTTLETILFSMGLSIGFLMIVGLLINEFCFIFSVSEPLTLTFLTVPLNIFILLATIFACLKGGNNSFLKISFKFHPSIIGLIILPILSILGSIYMNVYRNNSLLLLMIVAIALLLITGVFSKKLLPPRLYPLALLLIAVSLLFHSSFVSNYIFPYGSDSSLEFFVFKSTLNKSFWDLNNPLSRDVHFGRFYSMLSITIFPTIYSILLKIDPTWIFKVIYPLIFSFLPLGLYELWRKYIGEKRAYIAAFFFISYETFYTEMIGLNRQMIAELFFVLLLLAILNEKIRGINKMVCFVIFSFGLITSHYGLSLIFLFFIFSTFIYSFLTKKASRNITSAMVILFITLMFSWYIYTNYSAVFESILEFGNYVYNQLGDFFNPSSREPEVLRGLGLESPPTVWHAISRAFAYITEFLIVAGFVGVSLKKTGIRFDKDYFILTVSAMVLLAAIIIVPGLGGTMNSTRFYHILLFFLAPLCVVGAEFLLKLFKQHSELLISSFLLLVLVPYFLFQTCFIFEVVGCRSYSVPISGYRLDAFTLYGLRGYMDAYSVYGAQWLAKNVNASNSELYADVSTRGHVLTAYGMFYSGYVNQLSNVTIVQYGGIIYLSRLNVIDRLIPSNRFLWNSSELSSIFDDLNLIYANGGSEVRRN